MNRKRKIIKTLRSADRTSVERFLAENDKRNRVYEDLERRSSFDVKSGEYIDVVSGVERYRKRINISKFAAAAAAVMMVGAVGGGVFIMNNSQVVEGNLTQVPILTITKSATESTTDNTEYGSEEAAITTSLAENSGGNIEYKADEMPLFDPNGDNSLLKDIVYQRVCNSKDSFSKLSADWTDISYMNDGYTVFSAISANIRVDRVNRIFYDYSEYNGYENFDPSVNIAYYYEDNFFGMEVTSKYSSCTINSADADYGGFPDDVSYDLCNEMIVNADLMQNFDNWAVTGEDWINGRRCIYISIYEKFEGSAGFDIRRHDLTIDYSTGIKIGGSIYYNDIRQSDFQVNNIAFDDYAEYPKSPHDFKEYVLSSECGIYKFDEFGKRIELDPEQALSVLDE